MKAPKVTPAQAIGGVSVNPPFEKASRSATEFFHASLRALALETYTRITLRTPVRTGRARGNWHITINQTSDRILDRVAKGGPPPGELGKLNPSTVQKFPDIYIQNALPYIGELENGSSKQMPQGMVAVTLTEMG
jgi:hypothetical protein